jgi:hypothetical protein
VLLTKHFKGYEIMKEIMAKESSVVEQGVPSSTYSPAAQSTPLLFALSRPLNDLGYLRGAGDGATSSGGTWPWANRRASPAGLQWASARRNSRWRWCEQRQSRNFGVQNPLEQMPMTLCLILVAMAHQRDILPASEPL